MVRWRSILYRRCSLSLIVFFFQAEDGIRDLVRSRGLGDVYKRQDSSLQGCPRWGVRGVSSPTNSPPALQGPIGWTDGSDRLYMFGGLSGCGLWSNAIWVYTIDSTCGVCALTTEVQPISEIESGFSVFPNPTKGTFELSLDFKKQHLSIRVYLSLY